VVQIFSSDRGGKLVCVLCACLFLSVCVGGGGGGGGRSFL